MMLLAGVLAVTSAAALSPANAGCLSGAAVGGVAGHFVGHHRAVVRDREMRYHSNRY